MVLAWAGAKGPRTNHATRIAALNISPPARQGCQVTATPGRSGASADPRVTPSGGDYDRAEGKVAGARSRRIAGVGAARIRVRVEVRCGPRVRRGPPPRPAHGPESPESS